MNTKTKEKIELLEKIEQFALNSHGELFDTLCDSEALAQCEKLLTKKEMEMVEQFHRQVLDARSSLIDIRNSVHDRKGKLMSRAQ